MMDKLLVRLAVSLTAGTGDGQVDIPTVTADTVLKNGLNIVYFLAGTVAVIAIIIGGLTYSTSAGESGKITKAKNTILYAVIGLVVVLSAFAITNFVNGRFK